MIRVERHIADLLLEHDCISIPGLGGLVAQHFRSEINPGTHILRPPSKRISFHEGLTANAHLLVTRISDAERISLAKANDAIDNLVKDWQMTLAEGDSVKLDGIGRIYQDKKGAVCFNQSLESNFDLNAFGLDMFRATAIKRDVQIKEAVNTAIAENVKQKTGKAIPFWRAAAVFAGIGILLTVGLTKSNIDLQQEFKANFNPLHYSRTIEVPVREAKPVVEQQAKEELPETTVNYTDAVETIPESPAETSNSVDDLIVPASEIEHPYHVIVGSFKDVINAQDLILRLQRMGYDPQIIEDRTSFSKVSIQGFENRSQAASALKDYKARVNKGAWIYTRK